MVLLNYPFSATSAQGNYPSHLKKGCATSHTLCCKLTADSYLILQECGVSCFDRVVLSGYRRLQAIRQQSRCVPEMEHVLRTKQRFLKLKTVIDIQQFITGWFHGAHIEQIARGNVEDFVAYAFYSSSPSELSLEVGDWVKRN